MSTRILLADDHTIVRDGLTALLRAQPDFEVVGAVANGRDAVEEAARLQPDVAVLDISMPELGGIEATRRICADRTSTKVVILSMHDSAEHIYRALDAGASAYLLKESAGDELVAAVRAVIAGRRFLADKVRDHVIDGYLGRTQAASPLEGLSTRERDILLLLVGGQNNRDIAKRLSLSVKTIETYRSRMMGKLGIKSLPELVKFAINHGLVET